MRISEISASGLEPVVDMAPSMGAGADREVAARLARMRAACGQLARMGAQAGVGELERTLESTVVEPLDRHGGNDLNGELLGFGLDGAERLCRRLTHPSVLANRRLDVLRHLDEWLREARDPVATSLLRASRVPTILSGALFWRFEEAAEHCRKRAVDGFVDKVSQGVRWGDHHRSMRSYSDALCKRLAIRTSRQGQLNPDCDMSADTIHRCHAHVESTVSADAIADRMARRHLTEIFTLLRDHSLEGLTPGSEASQRRLRAQLRRDPLDSVLQTALEVAEQADGSQRLNRDSGPLAFAYLEILHREGQFDEIRPTELLHWTDGSNGDSRLLDLGAFCVVQVGHRPAPRIRSVTLTDLQRLEDHPGFEQVSPAARARLLDAVDFAYGANPALEALTERWCKKRRP